MAAKGLKGRSEAVQGNAGRAMLSGSPQRTAPSGVTHARCMAATISAPSEGLRGDAAIGEAEWNSGERSGNELGGRPSPLAGAGCAYGSRRHHVESSTPNRGVFSGRPSLAE
jgi:hypothetical protein